VDGKVDAQPLDASAVTIPAQGAHNVLFVATEHDSVYAFDADAGTQFWHVSLLPAGETTSDDRGCSQVSPEIGATSTPDIDRASGPNGALYAIAMSAENPAVADRRYSSGCHYILQDSMSHQPRFSAVAIARRFIYRHAGRRSSFS
jgi:glucose dehydrogenase